MLIRPIRSEDARTVIEVHHAAVRCTAAQDYSADILEQWAPLPVTDEAIRKFIENPDNEVRLLAELDGNIVGMAAIVPSECELRACYVAPQAGGQGIGTALLNELERVARELGLPSCKWTHPSPQKRSTKHEATRSKEGRAFVAEWTAHGLRSHAESYHTRALIFQYAMTDNRHYAKCF